jgi:hypothetical protein
MGNKKISKLFFLNTLYFLFLIPLFALEAPPAKRQRVLAVTPPFPTWPPGIDKSSKENFTPVLKFLTKNTSDVIIFSIASGKKVAQIIPQFIINTALKYPRLQFCVIAIDPKHTFDKLQMIFNKLSEYKLINQSKKNYTKITVFYDAREITNLSVIAFPCLFPNTFIYKKHIVPLEYNKNIQKWLSEFFKQKIINHKIILFGLHSEIKFNDEDLLCGLWPLIRTLKKEYPDQILIYVQCARSPWLVLNSPGISYFWTYPLSRLDYFQDKTNTHDRQTPFLNILDIELDPDTNKIVNINGTLMTNFPEYIKENFTLYYRDFCPLYIILRDKFRALKEKLWPW